MLMLLCCCFCCFSAFSLYFAVVSAASVVLACIGGSVSATVEHARASILKRVMDSNDFGSVTIKTNEQTKTLSSCKP